MTPDPHPGGRQETPVCGIVGVGAMGSRIARRASAAGWEVWAFDVDASAVGRLTSHGVRRARDLSKLSAAADLILVTVGPAARTLDVVGGASGGLLATANNRHVIAVTGTLRPDEAVTIAERCAAAGVAMVDVPLAGGEIAAQRGEAVAFAGADPSDLARLEPLLATFCRDVVHVGPAGAGQAVKLANNLLLWGSIALTVEATRLGGAAGVPPEVLEQALLAGSGRSWALETWDRPRPMPWCDEDMTMVCDSATAAELELPVATALRDAIRAIRRRKATDGFGSASLADWLHAVCAAMSQDGR